MPKDDNNHIGIFGGKSGKNRIAIFTDKFVSEAMHSSGSCDGVNCSIEVNVKKYPAFVQSMLSGDNSEVNYAVRLCIVMSGGSIKSFVSEYVEAQKASVSGKSVAIIVRKKFGKDHVATRLAEGMAPMVFEFMHMRRNIARWHGAEHMAISSYMRTGKSDISEIRVESPVNDKCGTRFLPFIFVGATVASLIPDKYRALTGVAVAASIAVGIGVDRKFGIDTIPGLAEFSRFFQENVTTRQPGSCEVACAHSALSALVTAHKELI